MTPQRAIPQHKLGASEMGAGSTVLHGSHKNLKSGNKRSPKRRGRTLLSKRSCGGQWNSACRQGHRCGQREWMLILHQIKENHADYGVLGRRTAGVYLPLEAHSMKTNRWMACFCARAMMLYVQLHVLLACSFPYRICLTYNLVLETSTLPKFLLVILKCCLSFLPLPLSVSYPDFHSII